MDLGALVRRLVAGPTGAGGAASSGDSGGAPAQPAPSTPDAPSGNALARPAWRDLPPLQRVVGAAPLVAPNAIFESQLASSRPAPIALAPLGHARGLEAPAGLVTGIAAPVQRIPTSPMPASVRPTRAGRTAEAVQRSGAGPAWPDASPSDTPSLSGEAPVATPPAATDLVVPNASSFPLTTAPSPGTGLIGFVGHAAVASAARGASLPATAVASSTTLPSAPSAPLVSRSSATDGGPTLGTSILTPASSLDSAAQASSSGDRPVRRIRLGAPLTPTVSRIAVPGTPATGQTGANPMPAPGMTSEIAMSNAVPDAPLPGSAAVGTLPTGPEAGAGAAGPAGDPFPAALQLVPLQRSAATTPATSPLVGGLRPMLATMSPAVTLARSAAPESEVEAPAPTSGPAAALAALARADTGAADWAPAAMAASSANAVPGGPAFGIEPPSPGGISPARLTWSNPMADLSSPSVGPGPLPSPATTSGVNAPAAPTISRSAARSGGPRVGPALGTGAVRPNAGTVGRSAAPGASPAAASPSLVPSTSSWSSVSTSSWAPTVSRTVVIDELDVSPEPPPSAAESGAGAAGASGGASASERGAAGSAGGGGSSGPGAAPSGMSEAARDQETQVWADRLYDRISLRLRRDLLVERERSGALVDRGF